MKSTGEVLGIDVDFESALYKGLLGAGYGVNKSDEGVLITVKDADKADCVPLAEKFIKAGYKIYSTAGTHDYLAEHGVESVKLNKFNEPEPNTNAIFDTGKIDFVVSTSKVGRDPAVQSVQMRRKAIERSIITLTSVDTANALVNCLLSGKNLDNVNMVDITKI